MDRPSVPRNSYGRRCVKRQRGFGRSGDLRSRCVPALTSGHSSLSLSIAPRPAGHATENGESLQTPRHSRRAHPSVRSIGTSSVSGGRDFKIYRNGLAPTRDAPKRNSEDHVSIAVSAPQLHRRFDRHQD
jgi:hypothetical protein